MALKTLRVAHSPDADDAFMFYGFAKGKVGVPGHRVRHVIADIQTLNKAALESKYEVTAISAAVYPHVSDRYRILSCGASVGRNYGPIVVAKKPFTTAQLRGKKIAVPGFQTTAYLLLRLCLDGFTPVEMSFMDIIPAVKKNRVDAGLVIHEGQINFASYGVHKCLDLGVWWQEKYDLPIPLGLDVVRRDLGLDVARKFNRALQQSIVCAKLEEDKALDYALRYARGISKKEARKFVRMYVNEDTLNIDEEGREALRILFRDGRKKKIFSRTPPVEVVR